MILRSWLGGLIGSPDRTERTESGARTQDLRIAIVTGASCAGKTTVCQALVDRYDVKAFDADLDAFGALFDMVGRPEWKSRIREIDGWSGVLDGIDVPALFALTHRDWYLRQGVPDRFVAVGWIYGMAAWRRHLLQAFRDLPGIRLVPQLFVLEPDVPTFHDRYTQRLRRDVRTPPAHFEEPEAGQRTHSRKQYALFREQEYVAPAREEMTVVERLDDEGLRRGVVSFLRLEERR